MSCAIVMRCVVICHTHEICAQTMYVSEEDFITQASACLSGFIDPVFLRNVFTTVHNTPRSEFEELIDAHSAFLGFLDLWEKRRKMEHAGAQVLFKLSRRVSSGM